ncbi:MAG: hypothetical protein IKV94_02830 [Clostridia bacterium]|nr:hypothetical protein [Clostridia bacterium]MBR6517123.1 hypothetical protein [Bacilli bacterium]
MIIFRYIKGKIRPIEVDEEQTTNAYMNDKIRNKKTQSQLLKEINDKYKSKLAYHIEATKVKNFTTGDLKTGKYHYEYHARTKNGYDIYAKKIEEIDKELKKDIYK